MDSKNNREKEVLKRLEDLELLYADLLIRFNAVMASKSNRRKKFVAKPLALVRGGDEVL